MIPKIFNVDNFDQSLCPGQRLFPGLCGLPRAKTFPLVFASEIWSGYLGSRAGGIRGPLEYLSPSVLTNPHAPPDSKVWGLQLRSELSSTPAHLGHATS